MIEAFEKAFSFFEKGGELSYPIFACSLIAVTIILERWWTYRKAMGGGYAWFSLLLDALLKREWDAAREILGTTNHPSGRVLLSLLEKVSQNGSFSRSSLEKLATHYGNQEVRELERYLPILSTIGNIAPLLGLAGTVLGMIRAFMQIETFEGKVNAAVLAGGIWEALLTTLFGLMVAIPAVMAHNILAARLTRIAGDLQDHAMSFIDAVEESELSDEAKNNNLSSGSPK